MKTKIIHDIATNQITEIPLSAEEAKLHDKLEKESAIVFAQMQSEAEATATAKAALLERLGITEVEAKLLLS